MNRLVGASVLTLILLAMLATGVYFYQRYSIILLDPMRAVPNDAAVIVEVKNPSASLHNFFSGSFRKNMRDDKWMEEQEKRYLLFDSLLKQDGDVSEIWEDQSLVISTHLVKAGTFDFLYLTNLPRGWTEQKLKKFIELTWGLKNEFSKREYENVNLYESRVNDSTDFTFASDKSVAMFSFSSLLVEQAIRQLKHGDGIVITKSFRKVIPPASAGPSIQIYVNNQSFGDIATSISTDFGNQFFKMSSLFARWSGYKLEDDSEFLLLKGSTTTFDTTDHLSFLRNQKPQLMNVAAIAPSRTALLYEFSCTNFPEYYSHLKSNSGLSLNSDDQKKVLTDLQKKYTVSFESSFTSWIGNEMALVITEPAGNSIDNNVYGCVRAKDITQAVNQLNLLRDAVTKQSGMNLPEEKYRNYSISSISVKGIIPLLFGQVFSRLSNCYYTSLNGYLVFANQSSSLKSFIDENMEAKVLSKDVLFHDAADHLDGSCNAMLFVNPERSTNLYLPSQVNSFLPTLYKCSGIYSQWTYSGASIQSQILFDFHKKTMKEPVLFWSTQLDTVLSSIPVTINDEQGRAFLFVQDAKNNFYKIDESGNIVWKKNLESKIRSEIFAVDFYHDGRHQLLFNTEKQLFLFDLEGNNTGNYPIRLPASATNGCCLLPSSSGFNMYVACSNHFIYAYEAGGKPVIDWNYIHTESLVNKPIQSFSILQNSYLIVSEDNGTVSVTDKKGNQKISFKDKFYQSVNGRSFVSEADSSGNVKWITTDSTGAVILFSLAGEVSKKETESFSPTHKFVYTKYAGSSEGELFFSDSTMLGIFTERGQKEWTKPNSTFISLVSSVRLPDGTNGFLVSSSGNDVFFLLNSKGETEKGFPLKGSINPVMTEMNRAVIICGNKEGIVNCYKTE